jgi:hypothetical protein
MVRRLRVLINPAASLCKSRMCGEDIGLHRITSGKSISVLGKLTSHDTVGGHEGWVGGAMT